MSGQKSAPYVKREVEESIFRQMNTALAPLSANLLSGHDEPKLPSVFIVGCQRSGTTLLVQMLASTRLFGYISNVAARFWESPVVGAVLQAALDGGFGERKEFSSDLGFTKDCLEPHEASYFWKRWFQLPGTHRMTPETLNQVNWQGLRQELAALQHYFGGLPLVFKNPIYHDFHISELAREIPHSRFLFIERDPTYIIQSTLESAKRYYASGDGWFGPIPPGTEGIAYTSPLERVADQVFKTHAFIESSLSTLDSSRYMKLSYESLVADMKGVTRELLAFCLAGTEVAVPELDWPAARDGNKARGSNAEMDVIRQMWSSVSERGGL
ncbi:MAG: sulfotransferase [Verrucomicrobiaceae bacterium]|nr:sulfotransferase [Verrucomicrobiaceae bacterium]